MISCSLCYVSLRLILLAEVAEAVCSLTIAVNRTVEELSFRAVTGRAAAAWGLFAHLLSELDELTKSGFCVTQAGRRTGRASDRPHPGLKQQSGGAMLARLSALQPRRDPPVPSAAGPGRAAAGQLAPLRGGDVPSPGNGGRSRCPRSPALEEPGGVNIISPGQMSDPRLFWTFEEGCFD